jgi:hypothetical protein
MGYFTGNFLEASFENFISHLEGGSNAEYEDPA